MAESWSPYTFSSNNPILRNDPLGLKDTVVTGADGKPEHALANVTLPDLVLAPVKAKPAAPTTNNSSSTTAAVATIAIVTPTAVAETGVAVIGGEAAVSSAAPPVAIALGFAYLFSFVCGEHSVSVALPRYGPVDNAYLRPPSSPRTIFPPPPFYFAKDKDDNLKGGSQNQRDGSYIRTKSEAFQKWFHQNYKDKLSPQRATKQGIDDAEKEWIDLGKP